MCAARGKIILTLALHTILYLHPKFYQIIFEIDKITVISAKPPIFPPNSPWGVGNVRMSRRHELTGWYIYISTVMLRWRGRVWKVCIIYFSKGELGGNIGGEAEMTVVLWIWKIISWNLGWRYKIVYNASFNMIFPLAAHLGEILQHWLIFSKWSP